jgi:hypothetical protein
MKYTGRREYGVNINASIQEEPRPDLFCRAAPASAAALPAAAAARANPALLDEGDILILDGHFLSPPYIGYSPHNRE